MMAKIFRLHTGGTTANSGWFSSSKITTKEIGSITTDGKGVASSIPSPFAQMDLVKSAFRWVADNGIKGQSAQHKLVSDALDIGQLFFLSDMYPGIEIVEWNPNESLKDLKIASDSKHKDLAETLDIYWKQDAQVYHFDKVDRLFFILYNGKLVGGTSPSTLFFAAPDANANDLKMDIVRGGDMLLDDIYADISEREYAYIEYLYALSKSSSFQKYYQTTGHDEFYDYIQKCFLFLPKEMQKKINAMDANSILEYDKCLVSGSTANYCDILGIPLGIKSRSDESIEKESDFVVVSSLSKKKPLILPFDKFSSKWVYSTTDVKWDSKLMKDRVPYMNTSSEELSKLPVHDDPYFWMSIGNFMANKVISLPYQIDGNKFELCGSKKYLLPLTKTFFEYFTTQQVSKIVKVKELSTGGVVVKLDIPVTGGVIPFKKIYSQEDIVSAEIYLSILPFVKIEQFKQKYTIGIIDSETDNTQRENVSLSFYKKGEHISGSNTVERSSQDGIEKTMYMSAPEFFDTIELRFGNATSYIIPKMKQYQPNADFVHYAIDFGTTNTHIEYIKDGQADVSLTVTEPNTFWASLIDRSIVVNKQYIDEEVYFDQELFPKTFNKQEFGFPVRTALVENSNINYQRPIELYKHLNNYFLFNDVTKRDYVKLKTNLKWSNYSRDEDKKRVESYIEFLLSLVYYNSLILNSGLENTKITWFYPISMTSFQKGILKTVWEEKYKAVFGDESDINNLISIPESIAPFYYYKAKEAVLGTSVSIDIGGGSSDIAIFEKEKAISLTSFRFGANSIFGDGYGGSPKINGYVHKFKSDAERYFKNNTESSRNQVFNDILHLPSYSSDFSSFLFSLKDRSNSNFDYAKLIIGDMYVKMGVLIYYSAIGYYIAQHLNGEKLEMPKNFLFSGTGAKSLKLIDSSENFEEITDLYQFFIKKIAATKKVEKIESKLSIIPKEITCKGGLLKEIDSDYNLKFWMGTDSNELTNNQNTIKYNNLSDDIKTSITDSVKKMYLLMDEYFENNKIDDAFGISLVAYDLFKQKREEQLLDFLDEGIRVKIRESGIQEESPIEETLFFYPFVGIINKLSYELSKIEK